MKLIEYTVSFIRDAKNAGTFSSLNIASSNSVSMLGIAKMKLNNRSMNIFPL